MPVEHHLPATFRVHHAQPSWLAIDCARREAFYGPDPAAAAGGRVNQAAHRFSPAWATGRQQLVRQHCKLHASSCRTLQPQPPGAILPRAQANLSSQRAIAGSAGTTAARTASRTDRSSGGRAVPAAPGAAAAGERSEPLARRARLQRRQPQRKTAALGEAEQDKNSPSAQTKMVAREADAAG